MGASEMIENAAVQAAGQFFTDDYVNNSTIEERKVEGLGIAISIWADWTGLTIMEVFANALEDANYHKQCEIVRGWIEKEKAT